MPAAQSWQEVDAVSLLKDPGRQVMHELIPVLLVNELLVQG